ncbi:MAG: RNA polymerase sigma-54 factor [Candidatus Cloacimonadota bacterium]|nr:MAG: RNA polymerase sigma-54 factor [Candidatus Cloacimonadota bacterium]
MAKIHQVLSHNIQQRMELRPKMLQSLELLVKPMMELELHLKHELITNPMLDIQEETIESEYEEQPRETENDDVEKTLDEAKELSEILDQWNEYHSGSYESGGSFNGEEKVKLDQYLQEKEDTLSEFTDQLYKYNLKENEIDFGMDLIESVNSYGFLDPDYDIYDTGKKYELSEIESDNVHQIILHLKPAGITALSISECLMAQLNETQSHDLILTGIIKEDFDNLIHRRYRKICNKYKISLEELNAYKEQISKLDPKPGLRILSNERDFIVPDVIIKRIDNEFEVIVNDRYIPKMVLSKQYRKIIQSSRNDKDAVKYVRDKVNSAKFLIKSLFLRNRTLERVTRTIIENQKKYFYEETGILEPLTYSVIAQKLQVNESTISRVVRNKYADTPFGIVCLKDYFTSSAGKDRNYDSVSRQMVEKHIEELTEKEDKSKPISDRDIAAILKERGISVSRRVIAKYREGLGILNSRLRRKA